MTENTLTRRKALRLTGLASGVGLAGLATGKQTENELRLIETEIEYQLPDGSSYHRFHHDSAAPYHVDEEQGVVKTTELTPDALREKLSGDKPLVRDQDSENVGAAQFGNKQIEQLPLAFATRSRLAETVSLSEPVSLPSVRVRPGQSKAKIETPVGTKEISPGNTVETKLPSQEVVANTITVLDEKATDSSIPPHRRGLKEEYGTVSVTATPSLRVRDYGKLSVEEK
jgi:hypothetical protein